MMYEGDALHEVSTKATPIRRVVCQRHAAIVIPSDYPNGPTLDTTYECDECEKTDQQVGSSSSPATQHETDALLHRETPY